MKSYKLTPLDELHLEKKKLREERAISGQRLSYQIQYLADNWGSMLTKGVTTRALSRGGTRRNCSTCEDAGYPQQDGKTPWSFTIAWYWSRASPVQDRREALKPGRQPRWSRR